MRRIIHNNFQSPKELHADISSFFCESISSRTPHFLIILPLTFCMLRKARIFLLTDLQDFFSDLGSEGRKKKNKKALKMTS